VGDHTHMGVSNGKDEKVKDNARSTGKLSSPARVSELNSKRRLMEWGKESHWQKREGGEDSLVVKSG